MRTPDGPRTVWIEGERVALLRGDFEAGFERTGQTLRFDAAALLAPVQPSKVVLLASNYPKHAAEMGNPVPSVPKIFLKPSTAVIGPNEPIVLPPVTTRVDPEGELAFVIGRRTARIAPEQAWDHIFGFTAVNDVTARDFQKQDKVFARAKGFDSFCPTGPWIETDLDVTDVPVTTSVNGVQRAIGYSSHMVFDIPSALSFISHVMTLLPGDLVSMGTCPGVAPIVAGDVVEVAIAGLGVLRNPVVDRDDR